MPQTLSQTYTPTFLEKLLGRNYKWWYLVKYTFKQQTIYFWSHLFFFGSKGISIYGLFLVWAITKPSQEIFTYLILATIFTTLSNCRVYWEMGRNIQSGKITNRLLNPISLIKSYLFQGATYTLLLNFLFFDNIFTTVFYFLI